MSKIRVPKPFSDLVNEFKNKKEPDVDHEFEEKKVVPSLSKYGATDRKGRYLHWDEFKWRVERGDDELVAWVATKINRKARAKYLQQLQADKESCFSYSIPDSLHARLYSIHHNWKELQLLAKLHRRCSKRVLLLKINLNR